MPIEGFLVDGFVIDEISEEEALRAMGWTEERQRIAEFQRQQGVEVKRGTEFLTNRGQVARVEAVEGTFARYRVAGEEADRMLPVEKVRSRLPRLDWQPPKVADRGRIRCVGSHDTSTLNPIAVEEVRRALGRGDEVVLYSQNLTDDDFGPRVRWLLMKERIPVDRIQFRFKRWEESDVDRESGG